MLPSNSLWHPSPTQGTILFFQRFERKTPRSKKKSLLFFIHFLKSHQNRVPIYFTTKNEPTFDIEENRENKMLFCCHKWVKTIPNFKPEKPRINWILNSEMQGVKPTQHFRCGNNLSFPSSL